MLKLICKTLPGITFCLMVSLLFGQPVTERQVLTPSEKCAKSKTGNEKSQNVRVVFYNTENLYDPYDDTTTLDDEFTVSGKKRWTYNRFSVKLAHLAKTLLAVGGEDLPALIGLSEIENRYVMNKIVHETPLKRFNYRFVHHESPDARGIDVALLYRPEKFTILSSKPVMIRFPEDSTIRTREILYVCGILFGEDTLHLFVNHWPSKRGGAIESENRRRYVAGVLRHYVDSIFARNKKSNILIMGDLNDEPDQPSLTEALRAGPFHEDVPQDKLVNLMYELSKDWSTGTHKFQGKWAIIDQFIVSQSLIKGEAGIQTSETGARIFQGDFLFEKETTNLGKKPLRSYAGPRYTGGFSDHLPIYVDILKK